MIYNEPDPKSKFYSLMRQALDEMRELRIAIENVDASNRLRRQQIIRSLPSVN